jgi:hypothetical protein
MRWLPLVCVAALGGCSRVKDAEAQADETVASTLPDIWAKVFRKQCAFSSCHSMEGQPRDGLALATSHNAEPSQDEYDLACANLIDAPVENTHYITDPRLRVVPGDAQNSFLVQAIEGRIDIVSGCATDTDCNCPMPFNSTCTKTLADSRILAIRRWIDDGVPGCANPEPAIDAPPADARPEPPAEVPPDAPGDTIGD